MESILSLNILLAAFKAAYEALVPFDMEADDDNRAEQKRTFLEERAAETLLYKALIGRSVNKTASGFRLKSGTQGVIGTVGMLINGAMLNYADEVGSKYCMGGVSLLAIVEFFEHPY